MAVSTTNYRIERLGRPLLVNSGLVMFSFGQEISEVSTCAVTEKVLKSEDMAMASKDGQYISAQYRGVPSQCGFKLSSVETKKPIITK